MQCCQTYIRFTSRIRLVVCAMVNAHFMRFIGRKDSTFNEFCFVDLKWTLVLQNFGLIILYAFLFVDNLDNRTCVDWLQCRYLRFVAAHKISKTDLMDTILAHNETTKMLHGFRTRSISEQVAVFHKVVSRTLQKDLQQTYNFQKSPRYIT